MTTPASDITCKHCGARGLHWDSVKTRDFGNMAILRNRLNSTHSCLQDPTHAFRDKKLWSFREEDMPNLRRPVPVSGSVREYADSRGVKYRGSLPLEDDHSFDAFRYYTGMNAVDPPDEYLNAVDESSQNLATRKTSMDFALIHANQQNYVALEVTFPSGGQGYWYKAEASDNWKVGDHAVVLVKQKTPDEQLQVVTVRRVETDPVAVLTPDRLYVWVVQKVNMFAHSSRMFAQDEMVKQLNRWNAAKQAQELIAAQKALVAALPNGEAELANFAQLGQAQPVQVTL